MRIGEITMDTNKILNICQTSIKPICTNASDGFPDQLQTFTQVLTKMQELGAKTKFENELIKNFQTINKGIETLLKQTNQLNDTLVKMCNEQIQYDNKQ